jgi:RHS repeat-associated protein
LEPRHDHNPEISQKSPDDNLRNSNGLNLEFNTYDPTTLVVDTETVTYDLDTNGTPELTRVIDRKQDSLLRDKGFDLKNGPIIENAATYTYGLTDGRLRTVSNPQIPNLSFTYDYLTNSNLIEKVTGPIHDVVNTYEPNRDVLDIKTNKLAITVISKYDYAVNQIGQRSGVATSGTAFPNVPSWLWGYDSLGQVTSADSSVFTSDRAYQFDSIGNRKKSANSLTLPPSDNYTANVLNQYSTANGVILPTAPTPAPYDFDGNLRFDGGVNKDNQPREYIWDAENRKIEVKNSTGTTIEKNVFDSGSRKIATTANGITTVYLYEGFNCIAEYEFNIQNSSFNIAKTRLWGTDLSGTLQGAGGVGGLLSESHISKPQSPTFYPTYDGNGNVSEYLKADGDVSVHFEYDPFGNTVVNTDTSNQFAYRFSTKPLDFVTGFYYYTYRYYDPVTGRWPSRDPIGERGGVNLYGFVGNDGLGRVDILGLDHELSTHSFDTMDAAALPALLIAGKMQIADKPDHFEYSGAICCSEGKFKFTGPFKGNDRAQANKEKTLKCPEGWKLVAYYHSHPGIGSFNYGDTLVSIGYNITAYVVGTGIGLKDDKKLNNLLDDMFKYKAIDPSINKNIKIPNISDKDLKNMSVISQVHESYKFDKKTFKWVRVSDIDGYDYEPYINQTKETIEIIESIDDDCCNKK